MAEFPITRKAKENLLSRYEDLKFIDDVTKLSCKKCNRVPINHYISNCGHLFCQNCQRILGEGKGWKCPECKTDITDITRQDAEVERRVAELKVHCPNGKYGCKVDGSLQHISEHLASCKETRDANLPRLYTGSQFMDIIMEKLAEQSKQFQQFKEAYEDRQQKWQSQFDSCEKTMTSIIAKNAKMRQTIAEYRLQDRDEFSSRLIKEVDRLDSKLITADNEKTTMSNHLDKRISVADNRVVSIDKNLSNINIKMAMFILLLIAATAIATAILFAFNKEMQRTNENINNKVASLDSRLTVIGMTVTTIDNQSKYITQLRERCDTLKLNVTDIDNKMTTMMNRVEGIDTRLTAHDNKDTHFYNLMTTKNSNLNLFKIIMSEIDSFTEQLSKDGQLATVGFKDGSLVSQFTWTVKNIEEEIIKAKGNEDYSIESQLFYTNVPGYRIELRLDPNDRGEGYVGVYMNLVAGEFDNLLLWPFSSRYDFVSVGRDGSQIASFSIKPLTETACPDSFIKPPNPKTGCGEPQYIKTDTLLSNKDQYLIDGALSIQLKVWLTN